MLTEQKKDLRHRAYTWLQLGLFSLLVCFPGAGWASFVEDDWVAQFVAPEQSMWTPGGPTGFSYTSNQPYNDGTFSAAMNVNLTASAGTVSGNVEGLLKASYDNHLNAPGNTYIEFQFAGIPDESKLRTNLGANLKIDMNFGVQFPWWTLLPAVNVGGTLIDSKPSIKSNTDFTYSNGSQIKGTAEFAPTIGSLGFDAVVAGVGVDLKVLQDVYFTPGGINGHLAFTHLDTGKSGWTAFSAKDKTWTGVTLPLDLPGYWALTLDELTLASNSFYTDIGLGAGINMWATILGSLGFSIDLDIYRNNPFSLTFEDVDKLGGSMLIYVDEKKVDSVPEPGTVWLLATGLIAFIGVRRI